MARPFEIKHHLRIISLILLAVVTFGAGAIRAFEFQIVEGEDHLRTAQRSSDITVTVMAARGEIVDRNGVPFTHNKAIFNVEFDYSFLRAGTENETIHKLIKLMEKNNEKWIDEMPITKTMPYQFIVGKDADVARLKKKIRANDYATPTDCMENMYLDFKIKKSKNAKGKCTHCGDKYEECTFEGYSELDSRKILGVRYEMMMAGFSVNNRYVFANDINPKTVALIKEFSNDYRGAFVVEQAQRTYISGEVASHLIGTIGPIYAEEVNKYINKDKPSESDYFYSDLVGKGGIEKASEKELKGKNGKTKVSLDSKGNIIDTVESVAPIAGKTVQLTINYEFQKELQQILADYIKNFNETNKKDKFSESGAIVVLDATTGGVLASVSYPYYDINDYINNYDVVKTRADKPLNNRALNGSFRPGSTFKPIVAAAGFDQGLLTPSTEILCTGKYTFWGTDATDYQPGCLSIGHGRQNLTTSTALQHSCNIFFYDVGRRLGIDNINKYANYFGIGVDTGLEIPNINGTVSGPALSEKYGTRWEAGNVVQAAVGQQDTGVTPLQMAIEAMTIANKGTRFNAHLIDGYLTNDGKEVISKKETIIASQYEMSDEAYSSIVNGMILAGKGIGAPNQLTDLGYDVAIKTGTPQTTPGKTNNTFIAFAPVNEPEIAVSCMIENGDGSNQLLRRIIDAYNRTK